MEAEEEALWSTRVIILVYPLFWSTLRSNIYFGHWQLSQKGIKSIFQPRQPNEQRRLRRRWHLQEVDREGAATRQRRQEVQPQAEEEHPVDLDESIQDSTDDEGEADEQEHEWSAMAAELSDQPGPSSARP